MASDPRQHSPAAERNSGPLLAELERLLPERGVALEIASGTGQHAAHFAAKLPGWQWQPTDADPQALASIGAWCEGLPNVRTPVPLDVLRDPWLGVPEAVDLIFCANLLHISPWPTCAALMRGAARHLTPSGLLLIYGPFVVDGVPTAQSNVAFDADLRRRNAAWGLRRLGDVVREAEAVGLAFDGSSVMPANNVLLVVSRLT